MKRVISKIPKEEPVVSIETAIASGHEFGYVTPSNQVAILVTNSQRNRFGFSYVYEMVLHFKNRTVLPGLMYAGDDREECIREAMKDGKVVYSDFVLRELIDDLYQKSTEAPS